MTDIVAASQASTPSGNLITLTHAMYAMHAFSAVMGILTPAMILTAFLTGWPSIIAIILNYIKRDDVRGSYLESHFGWQRRTFWFALLWVVIIGLLILMFFGIPIPYALAFGIGMWTIAYALAFGVGIWVLYRIIRGWIALLERKPLSGWNHSTL